MRRLYPVASTQYPELFPQRIDKAIKKFTDFGDLFDQAPYLIGWSVLQPFGDE